MRSSRNAKDQDTEVSTNEDTRILTKFPLSIILWGFAWARVLMSQLVKLEGTTAFPDVCQSDHMPGRNLKVSVSLCYTYPPLPPPHPNPENSKWLFRSTMAKSVHNILVYTWNDDWIGSFFPWWRHQMETFSALLALVCGEFTGHRWIPLSKATDRELWCFLWSAPEQMVE